MTDRPNPREQLQPPCRWCAAGEIVVMLDADGTRTDVSKRPGTPCHARDDAWWPCPNWQLASGAPLPAGCAFQTLVDHRISKTP